MKTCVTCGKSLVGRQQKYCSPKCKSRPYSERTKGSIESSKRASIRWKKERRQRIYELLGNFCFICRESGELRKLHAHRKDGSYHGDTSTERTKSVLEEPEKYVHVCYLCHKGVHWCMEYFKMRWEDIIERLIRDED